MAPSLGQETLVFIDESTKIFDFTYDRALHEGGWEFVVKACIRIDNYAEIYCDPGTNIVLLTLDAFCDRFGTLDVCQSDSEESEGGSEEDEDEA